MIEMQESTSAQKKPNQELQDLQGQLQAAQELISKLQKENVELKVQVLSGQSFPCPRASIIFILKERFNEATESEQDLMKVPCNKV